MTSGSGSAESGYTFRPSSDCHLDEANGYQFPEGYGYLVTDSYPWVPMGYMGTYRGTMCYLDSSPGLLEQIANFFSSAFG